MLRPVVIRITACLMLLFAMSATAQQAANAPAASVIPRLVNYPGKVMDAEGRPVAGPATITFAIYKDEQGGEALWRETQNVRADAQGAFMAELGATESGGIPIDLFGAGESRWLGVTVNGANERPRAMLLSVPYALKAADAETLGGLPASAYMRADASNAIGGVPPLPATLTGRASPKVATNPAITGSGIAGYIPMFDSASDIVDSFLFLKPHMLGVGTSTPVTTLDVSGNATIRDTLTLVPKASDTVLAVTNSTFKISQNGAITFAAGQTFPGAGTIKGVTTATGSGLTGGGTTGTLALSIPAAGVTNTMLQHPSFTLPVTAPLLGGGAITLGATATALSLKPCPAGELYISNGTTWSCTAAAGTGKVTSVGLSAPTTDFTVSGSPITGAGTLAFKWTVPPSSANAANAIVKRDASGSFGAGSITAGGTISAQWLVASVGVEAYSPNGVGVYGESDGSQGGDNGVQGNSYAPGGSGVAGFASSGIGVYGNGPTGVFGTGTVGFATDSNVQQARSAGGWVKAMVYVNAEQAPYTITRCFNSTLTGSAATTPPCGIALHEVQPGDFELNFNFQVNDRFFATTIGNNSDATIIQVYTTGTDQLEVFTLDNDFDSKGAEYSLIVF